MKILGIIFLVGFVSCSYAPSKREVASVNDKRDQFIVINLYDDHKEMTVAYWAARQVNSVQNKKKIVLKQKLSIVIRRDCDLDKYGTSMCKIWSMADTIIIKNDRIEFYEGILLTSEILFAPGFGLPEKFARFIERNKVQSLIFTGDLDAVQAYSDDVLVVTK